ncbi:MAG TPA: CAP domain-containing protein [Patescibacteria group bacterium]|nr:CAP domain-containing protein [Patescibacteria group bacterium]
MNPKTRAPGLRRLTSLTIAAVLGLAILAPVALAGTAPEPVSAAAMTAAEKAMVAALNADRAALGLVAVQVDARLMAVARARSVDMATKGYFSHTQPDGRNVFSLLTAQPITWYNAGEIIAWNNYPMDSTVSTANRQWMNSAGHKAIIISTDFNYVGVGLALDPATGKKLWTAVYIKGPDRTGARATVTGAALRAGPTASTRYTKLTWSGYDPKLQVLTAGLASFSVQRRVDGGAWTTAVTSTTYTSTSFKVVIGHVSEFRVAARDKKGNQGAWSTRVIDLR